MGNDSQYKVATDTINVLSADHSPTRKLKAKEKNPEFVKFGQCIQKHRKAQKLTQSQLAAMLGITTKSVSYRYGYAFAFLYHG